MTSPTSVLLAGGGSAGHVSPLLALADALVRRHPGIRVTALGFDLRFVPKVPLPRRPTGDVVRLPGRLREAVAAAGRAIDETGAQVVVGFGGYVSTPAYLAARRRRVPIVIHEQNARAGLANRLGARWTPFVATTFSGTALPHARRIGMPLRREITGLDRAAVRSEALAHFGLDPEPPTVLVTGGSLGAKRINEAFASRAAAVSRAGVQVLHVTGLGKEFVPERPEEGAAYVVVPYVDRMELAYAAADLVVARAGANTVCELTAVGLPAVYVPLPIGNGEQRLNVAEVVAAGAGTIMADAAMTGDWVEHQLVPLAMDHERVSAMARAAAALGERAADELLADLVDEAWRSRS